MTISRWYEDNSVCFYSEKGEFCFMNTVPQTVVSSQQGQIPIQKSPKKSGLLLSVEKIQEIATREQLGSDGGGTGRSDTNDNKLNTV